MFASPTGYMLTSSGVLLVNWVYSSIDSPKTTGNFLAVLNLNLNQFVCNFSMITTLKGFELPISWQISFSSTN